MPAAISEKLLLDPQADPFGQEAADVIGVPSDQVVVTLSPHFVTDSGAAFAPGLPLTLSTTQLALADASALSVTDPGTVQTTTTALRTLELGGHEISVAAARTLSIVLVVVALLVLHWSHSNVDTFVVQDESTGPALTSGAAVRVRDVGAHHRVGLSSLLEGDRAAPQPPLGPVATEIRE